MELQFLGTGAGVPSKQRNVSSCVLKLLDEINELWMFDCGEATQHKILYTTLRPRKVSKIFITHLHGDHIFGLPGFLSSRSFQGGETDLEIIGPEGIKTFVLTALKLSQSQLSYRLTFQELPKDFCGTVLDTHSFSVVAAPLDHRITSFGYRVIEKDKQGELLVGKLKEEGVAPGPIYKELKEGKQVTLPDGRMLNGADYVGPSIPGRIVTILGDTRRHQHIDMLAQDADVCVHEATFQSSEQKLAHNYYHSTVRDAAEMAKRCNVQTLYLTHISARYTGQYLKKLLAEGRAIFPNTYMAYDLACFDIPRK